MKKSITLLCAFIFCSSQAISGQNCFISKEKNQVLKSEGDCNTAYTPQSTFKIALSLIGFESGILRDGSSPSWSIPKEEDPYINVCKTDHTPSTWMRDSCLWYSRILTKKLGMKQFQHYVHQFKFGNMDVSGDKGENNGLTQAWVTSSLHISPVEYTVFLDKLANQQLPISKTAQLKTKNILFIQEMPGGWKLYGKTGTGQVKDSQGNKTDRQHGWFVGYIEKGERKVVFASHVVDTQKSTVYASLRARNKAFVELFYLIDRLEDSKGLS